MSTAMGLVVPGALSRASRTLHIPETNESGDRTLLDAEWLTRRRALLNLCLRWTAGNVAEAEDLLSDACLRILEQSGNASVGVAHSIGFWATVINNLGRDRVRRIRRWKFDCLGDDPDPWAALPAHTISAEQHVASKERLSAAIAKLACLSENQRNAILLRCAGLGYSGIGEMLGTSEANARKLVEAARRALNGSGKRWAHSLASQRVKRTARFAEQ